MKTIKGVVFASKYLQINGVIKATQYFKKVQICIKNVFCLNNDRKVIISKAEKDQICVKLL